MKGKLTRKASVIKGEGGRRGIVHYERERKAEVRIKKSEERR